MPVSSAVLSSCCLCRLFLRVFKQDHNRLSAIVSPSYRNPTKPCNTYDNRMRLAHLFPLLFQCMVGLLVARAEDPADLISMYIWTGADKDAVVVSGPEWTGVFAAASNYKEENKEFHPKMDYRMIGKVQLGATSYEDFSIYFGPFAPTFTQVKVSHYDSRYCNAILNRSAMPLVPGMRPRKKSAISTCPRTSPPQSLD